MPDVAQIEYYALPQFALTKSLTDLTRYGADKLEGNYTPGPWNSVNAGDRLYGLPMDSGPMALFYNKKVFDKYGITVPTTWDEYVAGRGSCTRPTRRRTSPTTPATPASPPA